MTSSSNRARWLLWIPAVLGAVGWTALVHARVPSFFAVASAFCAGWICTSVLALGPSVRELLRFRLRDLFAGLGMALILFVGARLALRLMCGGVTDAWCEPTRTVFNAFGPASTVSALALAFLIAPGEEFFWRGVLQTALRAHIGPSWALLLTAATSSALLLAFGEPLLALAAFPTSIAWGFLLEWRKSLWPSLVSHAAWDLLIFVFLPPD